MILFYTRPGVLIIIIQFKILRRIFVIQLRRSINNRLNNMINTLKISVELTSKKNLIFRSVLIIVSNRIS